MPDLRLEGVGMARTWLEANVFVTLPVLKTLAATVFPGCLKNQWGRFARHDRILVHKCLHELIDQRNSPRPVSIAFMDGLVGIRGAVRSTATLQLGYSAGQPRPACSGCDGHATRLIGLEPATSRHLVHAEWIGMG
jgi:uncharacterized protein (DUF362 family)